MCASGAVGAAQPCARTATVKAIAMRVLSGGARAGRVEGIVSLSAQPFALAG